MDDELRRVLGTDVSDAEAEALVAWYATLARDIAAFPSDDLKAVEPALRSIPGPRP